MSSSEHCTEQEKEEKRLQEPSGSPPSTHPPSVLSLLFIYLFIYLFIFWIHICSDLKYLDIHLTALNIFGFGPHSYLFKIYLFIYFWLCWVFVSVRGLPPVAASGGHSSSRCTGLSLSRPLPLWSTGSRRAGSVAVAHGPSCSAACGILPDQGSNPCPLHWQADSQPLCHQWSSFIFN